MNNNFSKYKIYAQLASASYNDGMSIPGGYKLMTTEFSSLITGFQASLYINANNEKILAIRGTDLALNRPIETIKDLYNDLQLALSGINLQEISLEKYYNKLIAQGIISPNEKITVVGHSLGGYLAQILTLKHPEVVNNTYTFNAPGIGGLPGTLLNALGIENFYNPKITDVVAKDGLSLIAGTGLNAGQEIEVSGESHSSVDLTKILYFYDEMTKNGVSEKDITNYLSGFYQIPSKIFDNKKSVEHIANKTLNAINKIVNGNNVKQKDIIDIAIDFEKNNTKFSIEFIFSNGFNQSTFPNSSIPISALYALVHLNPFIVSGVDSPVYKELEQYKDEYSDNYIQDKAVMFKKALDGKATINGIYFKDYESNLDLDTTQDFNGMYDEYHFGTNSNDTIEPIGTKISLDKNRIYALGGDDHIKAPNGSNYIEAGSGNDTIDLRSSKGENTVYGGVNNGKDNDDDGDDIIYGGEGKDTIYGGNGKDTIYTDNDDKEDLLYGGQGFDTYYVGDKDIIFDSDGKGKVVFDSVELKEGTYDKDKGAYVSKDGLIEYRLNESGSKSTLTVQKDGKSITINEFSKEDKSLGIKLANSKIEVSVTNKEGSANWLQESLGDRGLPFTLSLNRKLDKGEYLKVEVVTSMKGDKSIIEFKEGDISKDFNFTWKDDNYPQGNRSFVVNACVVDESSDITAEVISSARGTIKDDDRDPNNPNNSDIPTDPNDPENAPMYYDPIIIDLNKDGTTTSKLNGAVNFDMDNNGFKEATGWISKDDAFLAYDRNGNGIIDNGNELFGDKTVSVGAYGYTGKTAKNGFEALKEFDSNSDNVIDEKDKDFDKLLLWQDLNTNGLTEEGELKTLKEHNIKSIDLRYKETQIDNNGNLIKQTSTVTFNDNTTTTADDVWFKVDLRYTEQPSINIPERIKALPEVTAFGNLHNLRNAMSENLGLENMIKDYMGLSLEEKVKQLDSILFKWAGVEGVDKDSRGQFIDARMLGVYEKISGKPFLQWGNNPNPSSPAANIIMGIMSKFKNYVYANIELQTKYKGLIDTTYMYYNDDTNKYDYDFSKVNAKLKELYNAKNYKELSVLTGTIRDGAQYKSELLDSFKNNLEKLASNNDDLALFALSDYISGTDGDDVIRGKSDHNLFVGGKGNDVFHGGYGKNAYIYHKGDGSDTIYESNGESTIYFEDIRRDEVEFSNQDGSGLNIKIKGTQDSINIKQNYINNNILLKFSDGTVLEGKNINLTVTGDENDNTLYGYQNNDTIEGGRGNDKLNGEYGDDTYVYSKGDGNDVINDRGGVNILYFKDLSYDDVEFFKQDRNLLIKIKDTGETITINGILSYLSCATFRFKFSDGTIRDSSNINLTVVGDDQDNTLYGFFGKNTFIGGKGNDNIHGNNKDSTYVYSKGDGNDSIFDLWGKNTLVFKDINKDGVEFSAKGNDLLITVKDTQEYITLKDIFEQNDDFNFKFADGNVIGTSDLLLTLIGDDNDNILKGYHGNDILKGNGGNDTLYGRNGDDKLYGDEGDDALNGGSGNDILEGGKGNDKLNGEYGDDTYVYSKGDGNDSIFDYYGENTLVFKDINKNEVDFIRSHNGSGDLLIKIKDTNEQISIFEFFGSSGSLFDFKFADGATINRHNIALKVIGDDQDNNLIGHRQNDTLEGKKGNDILQGKEGDDTYIYSKGDGNDTVRDWQGSNTLVFKDINKNEVDFMRSHNGSGDLLIKIKDTNEQISISEFFGSSENIFDFKFADGATINRHNIALKIIGDDKDNTLNGYRGNDILEGKKGNDELNGEYGDDTYVYSKGDGNDSIFDLWGKNTLVFKDINKNEVDFIRPFNNNLRDLLIKIKDTNEQISISGFFGSSENLFDFKFADGSVLSSDEAKKASLIGNDNDNIIYGFDSDDILKGNGGNDKLYGEDGNDILEGGKGNDILYGHKGDDTYIFGKGDGDDVIYDEAYFTANRNDTIKFKADINKDDLVFTRTGDNKHDLLIKIKGSNDSITVKDMFKDTERNLYGINKITFDDGTSMSIADIYKATPAIANPNDQSQIYGSPYDDTIYGNEKDNDIRGQAGNDTLYGNEGNDTLRGDEGNDILEGGSGNDTLYGGEGEDTYIFGRGDGKDTIYADKKDIIKFKEGIKADDLIFEMSGSQGSSYPRDHILIRIKGSDDSILLMDMFRYEDIVGGINKIVFHDGSSMNFNEIVKKTMIAYGDEDVNISGLNTDDTIIGGKGNDMLLGNLGNDTIYGGSGNDTLYGGGGDDILDGGEGDDHIEGGKGSDTYMFGRGSGKDTVENYDETPGRVDIIKIKNGVSRDDLLVKRVEINGFDSLLLGIKDTDDSMTVKSAFYTGNNHRRIDKIVFEDGSSPIELEEIKKMAFNNSVILGGADGGYYYARGDNSLIDLKQGNDHIEINGKNIIYMFGKGDGQDTIFGRGRPDDKTDIIRFKEGITKDDLMFQKPDPYGFNNSTFIIKIKDTGDSITVTGDFLFNKSEKGVNRIEFSDGSFLDKKEIKKIMLKGTNMDDAIYSDEDNDVVYGRGGNDTIRSSGKNSIIYGGDGDDKLYAIGGGATFYGEAGNDELYVEGDGSHTLIGGAGDDTYICSLPSRENTITIDNTSGGNDTLVLKDANSPKSARFSKDGNDLLISGNYDGIGGIRIKNHFLEESRTINKIKFGYSDNSITQEEINKLINIVYLSSANGNNNLSDKDKKDNVYTYTGGKVTISDNGGDDRVVFRLDDDNDQESRVYYSSNGRDLKISTAKIDSSNKNVLEIKNFFVNRNSIIENFDINDYWSITAQSIYEKFGKAFPPETPDTPDDPTPSNPGDGDNGSLTGGSEDNVFNYKGGMVSITDTGGNDKVIFKNPGSRVFYSSNGRDLKISTSKINSSNKNVLEVKNFFSDKNYIIEEFQISDYWTVTAESIYQAFGKTYPAAQNAPLALLGVPNKTNEDSLNDNASDM